MKVKNERDFLSGWLFIVTGLLFGLGAARQSLGSWAEPGAGSVTLLLSGLVTVLGAVVLFKSLTIETEGGGRIGRVAWRPLLAITVSVVVFGATIGRLGLLLSVPLLVVLTSLAAPGFRAPAVLASAVLLTFVAWWVFVHGLELPISLWPRATAG